MSNEFDKNQFELTADNLLENVFYQIKTPPELPSEFGLSQEESEAILKLREKYANKHFEELKTEAHQGTAQNIVTAAKKLYGAMAVREADGDHFASLSLLCEALFILNNLSEEERRIEFWLRFKVNVGVQIAVDLGALTGDTYYPKMITKACAEIAPDGRLGNCTAWVTWAEYEIYDDERAGIKIEETIQKVHRILMDLKQHHPGFYTDKNLHSYLMSSYHFREYRNSPLYREFMGDLLKRR